MRQPLKFMMWSIVSMKTEIAQNIILTLSGMDK